MAYPNTRRLYWNEIGEAITNIMDASGTASNLGLQTCQYGSMELLRSPGLDNDLDACFVIPRKVNNALGPNLMGATEEYQFLIVYLRRFVAGEQSVAALIDAAQKLIEPLMDKPQLEGYPMPPGLAVLEVWPAVMELEGEVRKWLAPSIHEQTYPATWLVTVKTRSIR